MLLILIVLLTIASISLRFSILGLDLAFNVAKRTNKVRKNVDGVAVKATPKKYRGYAKVAKAGLNDPIRVIGVSAGAIKSVSILAAKSFLKLIRFVIARIRDALVVMSTFVLILDIVVFIIVVSASAGFLSIYCTTDENGAIVFNQDILDKLMDTSKEAEGTNSGLTEQQVQNKILKECKKVADYVRKNNFTYGDAPINPAMNHDAKLVSCDRYVGWVLYNLGWTDQPRSHGLVVRSPDKSADMTAWCEAHNFKKISSQSDLKPGDIMFVGKPVRHVYMIGDYDPSKKQWQRYDCGSNARIFGNKPSPSVEPIEGDWVYAYRLDYTKLGYGENSTSGGSGVFKKYNMSKEDVEWLTRLCEAENSSSTRAIAAEIATVCNLYELSGKDNIMSMREWCNLPVPPGWFASRTRDIANKGSGCNATYYKIVEAAVNQGKRIYPKYINEHDTFPKDIAWATNNGAYIDKSNRGMYKKNITYLRNVYGTSWTFYDFPDASSDPFGYTSEENRRKYGETCYPWEKLKQELGL